MCMVGLALTGRYRGQDGHEVHINGALTAAAAAVAVLANAAIACVLHPVAQQASEDISQWRAIVWICE